MMILQSGSQFGIIEPTEISFLTEILRNAIFIIAGAEEGGYSTEEVMYTPLLNIDDSRAFLAALNPTYNKSGRLKSSRRLDKKSLDTKSKLKI